MSKVNFYLLKQEQTADQYLFACRLCEKILSQKLKIYFHTDTEEQAQYLDDLLWSFRPDSFLPHCLIDTDIDEEVSVVIGSGENFLDKFDVLINLSENFPSFSKQYDRVVEIICSNESSKALGRQRWLDYKNAGFELEKHDL